MMSKTENQISESEVAEFVEDCKKTLSTQKSTIINVIERRVVSDKEHDQFFKYNRTTNQCLFDRIEIDFSPFAQHGKKYLRIVEIADIYIKEMRGVIEAVECIKERMRNERNNKH